MKLSSVSRTVSSAHLALALFTLSMTCPAASIPSIFGLEELRARVTRDQALKRFEAAGYNTVQEEWADKRVTIRDRQSNQIVGSLYFCDNILYANSVSVSGGADVMIRRASQLKGQLGTGKADAASTITDFGEVNTLTLTWGGQNGQVEIQFTAGAPVVNGSQWISYSVADVCAKQ